MQKKSFAKLPESQHSQNAFKIKKENNQIIIEDRKEVRLLFSALLFFLTHTLTHSGRVIHFELKCSHRSSLCLSNVQK